MTGERFPASLVLGLAVLILLCCYCPAVASAAPAAQLLQSARADFESGKFTAASLTYEKLLRLSLASSQLNEVLPSFCESTLREGRLARAESLIALSRTKLSDPLALARVAYLEAEISYFRGNLTGALTEYKDFVSSNSESQFANDAIDRLLLIDENGDFDNKPLLAYSYAEFLEFTGTPDSSLSLLRELLRNFPNAKIADDAHMKIGDILRSKRKFAEALGEYRVIEETFPQSQLVPVERLKIAELYSEDLGERDKAVAEYEAVITAFPGTSFAAEARGAVQKLQSGPITHRGKGSDPGVTER